VPEILPRQQVLWDHEHPILPA